MALKQTTKRKLTIISASLMCVFTACVAATSVLAWFSTNKNVNADRGHFSIAKVDSAFTAITVHDFYGSTQDGSIQPLTTQSHGMTMRVVTLVNSSWVPIL